MLNTASAQGSLNGIQFSNEGPAVYHLFFADDSLFLFKASIAECQVFQDIFNKYEEVLPYIWETYRSEPERSDQS